jgi:cytochrome c peroxidase
MHDGSHKTLDEVIAFYNKAARPIRSFERNAPAQFDR